MAALLLAQQQQQQQQQQSSSGGSDSAKRTTIGAKDTAAMMDVDDDSDDDDDDDSLVTIEAFEALLLQLFVTAAAAATATTTTSTEEAEDGEANQDDKRRDALRRRIVRACEHITAAAAAATNATASEAKTTTIDDNRASPRELLLLVQGAWSTTLQQPLQQLRAPRGIARGDAHANALALLDAMHVLLLHIVRHCTATASAADNDDAATCSSDAMDDIARTFRRVKSSVAEAARGFHGHVWLNNAHFVELMTTTSSQCKEGKSQFGLDEAGKSILLRHPAATRRLAQQCREQTRLSTLLNALSKAVAAAATSTRNNSKNAEAVRCAASSIQSVALALLKNHAFWHCSVDDALPPAATTAADSKAESKESKKLSSSAATMRAVLFECIARCLRMQEKENKKKDSLVQHLKRFKTLQDAELAASLAVQTAEEACSWLELADNDGDDGDDGWSDENEDDVVDTAVAAATTAAATSTPDDSKRLAELQQARAALHDAQRVLHTATEAMQALPFWDPLGALLFLCWNNNNNDDDDDDAVVPLSTVAPLFAELLFMDRIIPTCFGIRFVSQRFATLRAASLSESDESAAAAMRTVLHTLSRAAVYCPSERARVAALRCLWQVLAAFNAPARLALLMRLVRSCTSAQLVTLLIHRFKEEMHAAWPKAADDDDDDNDNDDDDESSGNSPFLSVATLHFIGALLVQTRASASERIDVAQAALNVLRYALLRRQAATEKSKSVSVPPPPPQLSAANANTLRVKYLTPLAAFLDTAAAKQAAPLAVCLAHDSLDAVRALLVLQ
jgi:hypothetical protein